MEKISKTCKAELLTQKEENRYFNLIDKIVGFIQEVKADEIYNAMKDSEYSKEYAVQRVKEMFEDCMSSEKEMFICQLEAEIEEEKELNRVLNDKNLDLDHELEAVKGEFKGMKVEFDKNKEELYRLQEAYKQQTAVLKGLEERQRDFSIKASEFDLTQSQRMQEELHFSKSQTLKLKKDLETLQRDKTVAAIKENEYKKDHQDLIMHLKSLQTDKECLEAEIEQLSQVNFDLKSRLDSQISSTQSLAEQNRRFEESLRHEVESNRAETDQMLLKFKEKTRRFKSKILEQKKKIEENSQFQYSNTKSLENRIKDLEAALKDRNLKISELEILLEKNELASSLKVETGKKQYEQLLAQRLSEMQNEVQVQVKRCQDYERQIKTMTETRLKALESKNSELETTKEELKTQLVSALASLEQLRGAYTNQLALFEEPRNENSHLKRLLNEYQEELKEKLRQNQSLETSLRLEQQRSEELSDFCQKLEKNLKTVEDDRRKTRQELEQTRQISRSLENNLENTLKESRNTQKEGLRVAELAEKLNSLETYTQKLEKQVRVLKTFRKNFRKSGLGGKLSSMKHLFKDVKGNCVSNFLALENYIHGVLEKISCKVIEKAAENRKVRSQYSAVKKENLSLTQSVSACSKEMDILSQEILEKQQNFRASCKQIKVEMKQKFGDKILGLERSIQELQHENGKIRKEAAEKLEMLQDEIVYYQSRESEKNELIRKTSSYRDEISLLEKRIYELEQFLDAERLQKDQLASLKNKEIEELKNKLKLVTRH